MYLWEVQIVFMVVTNCIYGGNEFYLWAVQLFFMGGSN